MKQKTGRKLLSFLLTLAMLVGLMPGMSLTAYAADEVAIGNGGYPYGTNMTSSITFIVDVAASSGGEYQWYVSDSSDGNYSTVADTSGSFEANADSFETTFTPIDGKWYKCRINNEAQCETQPVMAKQANGRWYISNGTMAYSFFENNTKFDVIGQINGTWVTQTSYDTYWNFCTSTEATPAPLSWNTNSSATLKSAKASFSTSNSHVVNFEATIGENEHAFAFGCDVKIRNNDNAPTTAIIATRTGSVKQMQLVDTTNLETAADTDPAMVVKYTTIPTHFWIGMWYSRYYYATNDRNTSTYYDDDHCSWNDAGVCYQYQGDDSGMTVSWTNRNGGDTIGFSFALGSVAETDAVTGKIDYSGEQIESLKANTPYVITVLDQDGNPTSETYTKTSDSNGCIPLAGTDDNSKAYDLIGKLIQIGVKDSLSDPMEMDIAPRPDTEDPSQSGEGIYEKPEDVKENEVFVTENSITIKPQTDIGKRQQYRLYNSVGEEIAGQDWQSLGSDGTITFTGLSPNTSYLVKAFIPATQTAPKSLPSQGAMISTFGTITVTKPTPTELTYNKELHSFPITVDPSDATVSYSTGENVNYNSEVPSFTDAGEYTVYYRVLKENYTNVYGSFPVKINKATNPTTVSESTSVYSGGKTVDLSANVTRNGATGAVSYTISGEANGCTVDSNGILTSGSTAGSVTVKVTVAEDTNYQALPEKTITVTINEKQTQTITASDVTATYGDTDKSISATTDGNGEISYAVKAGSEDYIGVDLDGKLTIKKVPADGKAYVTVTASETNTGGTGGNGYAAATKDVTVNISKATVTITAKDQSIYVGGTVPTLSGADFYTVTGLVGEETLTTAPTLAYQKNGEAATPDSATTGTYDIVPSGAAASDNYSISYTNGTLTISNKGTQTISAENVTATYGDTDKSVSATVTDPATGGGDIRYAVKEGSGDYIEINASTGALTIKEVPADGKAYVIVTAAETSTYTQATKEVTVTINKANAVAATVTANNRTYDVTEKPLVTVDNSTLVGGEMRYALGENATTAPAENLYTTSIPTATNAGTYYVWYKVKGDKDHLDSEPVCVEAAIAKRNVTLTSAEDSKDYDGKPLTNNNITVTGDGWAEGEGATYNVTGTQTLPGASDNGFTYTLNNNTKESNYNISKVINKLTVNDRTEKYEINVEVNSDNVTYDGNEHEVSGFKTLEFLCDDVTYTVSGLSASVIGTDAGTYDVVVTGTPLVKNSDDKDLTKQFIVNIVPGQLVIDTRNVSFTSASETKQYDGEPLTNDNVEITGDGFAEGEGASFDVTGNQLVVGSSANTFTYTLNEGTNPDNYSITSQEGTLTVTNRLAKYEIIPKANSGEFTYDGSEHSVTGFVTDTFEVATDDETTHIYTLSGLTAEGIGTDVGEYTVNITGTPVVIDAEGNDVSSEFSVTPVAGNIVINKRNVTLTSASDSKAYDGKELTNAEVTVSGDGWAEGEGAEYKVTGTRKLPGETRNSFTYTLNEGTNADNYEITSVEGILTITDRKAEDEEGSDKDVRYEITVVANSGNFTYDGTEHEVSGIESTEFIINDVTYTVSGLEASAKGTEVGTYPVKISGTPVVTDADGNDLTKQFTVYTKGGSLTVVEKTVNPEGDIRYSNYSGDRAVWTKGSNAGCEFVFKRSVDDELTFGHFTGIDVESKAVDASNYTAVSGSVVITLKPEYLETLAVGDHLLTANFDDGNSVTVKFTIKEKSEEKKSDTTLNNKKADVTPETGDTVNVQLIFLVMVLSMCVIFVLCNLRSKLDEKKRRR